MYCRFCGREIEDGSLFCRFCGKELLYHEKNSLSENKEQIDDVAKESSLNSNAADKQAKHSSDQTANIPEKATAEAAMNTNFESDVEHDLSSQPSHTIIVPEINKAKKSHKVPIIVGSILLALAVGYFILSKVGVAPSFTRTNYDGTYSGIVIVDGIEEPHKVIVKDGNMSITRGGNVSGKYEYNEDGDYIELAVPLSDNLYQDFILTKTGGKYYLTMNAGSFAEYTLEVAKGDDPPVTSFDDSPEEIEEKNTEKAALSDELSENYYVVGEDIDSGTYDFGPVDDHFSISVYDSMDYFKMSYDYAGEKAEESEDFFDHYNNYFGDEVVKGISLKKGNVLYVDYEGVKYKKH